MIELNTISKSDCNEYMSKIPDRYIDLVIVDPPYLQTAKDNKGRMSNLAREEYLEWSKKWVWEISRVLSEDGSAYFFSGDIALDLYQIIKEYLIYKNVISWIKKNRLVTTPQLRNWFPKTELVLYFSKNQKPIWNPIVRKYGIMESSNYQIIPNITTNMREAVKHPAQKPLALVTKFIEASSTPDSIVLDPFMGSGTTAVAAVKLGRNFLGCDTSQESIDIALERLRSIDC